MKDKREKRLNSELKRLIYEILTTKINNPLITEIFSVSEVDVSNDLEHATVYISVFSVDENKANATFEAICNEDAQVRHELSKIMRIRQVPQIHFKKDNSSIEGAKIDKIISSFTYGENNGNK